MVYHSRRPCHPEQHNVQRSNTEGICQKSFKGGSRVLHSLETTKWHTVHAKSIMWWEFLENYVIITFILLPYFLGGLWRNFLWKIKRSKYMVGLWVWHFQPLPKYFLDDIIGILNLICSKLNLISLFITKNKGKILLYFTIHIASETCVSSWSGC